MQSRRQAYDQQARIVVTERLDRQAMVGGVSSFLRKPERYQARTQLAAVQIDHALYPGLIRELDHALLYRDFDQVDFTLGTEFFQQA